jgi:hypothetical protein
MRSERSLNISFAVRLNFMENIETSQKAKAISVLMAICGLILFSGGILFLFDIGITQTSFQMIGTAFFSWAYAASPKVLMRSVFGKSKVRYGKLSKIFVLIAVLNFIAALVIIYYKKHNG